MNSFDSPRGGLIATLLAAIGGALVVVLPASQLLLGDAVWELPSEQSAFVAALALACAVGAVLASRGAAARGLWRGVASVTSAWLVVFGLVAMGLLLSRSFHSRPLLLLATAGGALLCAAMLLRHRKALATALTLGAAAALAAQLLGPLPAHELAKRSGTAGPQHRTLKVATSLHEVKADVFLRNFCMSPGPECVAPRFGGGISSFGDGWIVADGEGRLHFNRHEPGRRLEVRRLANKVPVNSSAFMGGRRDAGGLLFRVTDVLVDESAEPVKLYASHHWWHDDRKCFVLRVSRLTGSRDELLSTDTQRPWTTVFETEPCLPVLEPVAGSIHAGRLFAGDESGGRMALLAPGVLLLSVGDHLFNGHDRKEMLSQDPNAHHGKVLKIDLGTGRASVFTVGHRNPQGLAVTADGTIWSTEHGPKGGDELNLLQEGRNYGWPMVSYGTDYGSLRWPLNPRQGDHDGYERPRFAWVPSTAISNLTEVGGDMFGHWKGDLLAGSYGKSLWRIRVRDGKVAYAESIDVRNLGSGRVRDVLQDRSGRIVLWIDGGTIAVLSVDHAASTAKISIDGARTFDALCASCHRAGGTAFTLEGSVGRDIASRPGVEFSAALRARKGAWTVEALDGFLANPQAYAPGTSMAFAGVQDPEARRQLIAYLQQLR